MFNSKKKAPLMEYWECKLHINYDAEFEYYKKLCGLDYDNKLLYKYKLGNFDYKIMLYKEWENHIANIVSELDIDYLEEYSRFLNQQSREKETKFQLSQSLFIPIILLILGDTISGLVAEALSISHSIINILIIITIVVILAKYILLKLASLKEDSILQHFYEDTKQIVNKMIETKKISNEAGEKSNN